MRTLSLMLALWIAATASAVPQTTIEMIDFGVGNAFRPGGSVGTRIKITSDLDEAVTGLLQWEIENNDGDIAEFAREITIQARGGQTITWLYGVLPPKVDPTIILDTDWGFRLFELEEGEKVREIANKRLSPRSAQSTPRPVEIIQDQMLVIGPNAAGLGGYEPRVGLNVNPALNSTSAISWGVRTRDLPDSWEGLAPYSTIVWSQAGDPLYSPGDLVARRDVEDALKEWISRGGHLVILLPTAGDPWRLGLDQTALGDLFADIRSEEMNGVAVSSLLPALSADPDLKNPDKTITIHTFNPTTLSDKWRPLAAIRLQPDAPTQEGSDATTQPSAVEVLKERNTALPDTAEESEANEPVVWAVRKNFGYGAIDLVGIDVSNQDLQIEQAPRLPQTGVFWRSILGRRATAPSSTVLDSLQKDKRLTTASVASNNLGTGALISTQIGLGGAAAQGLLAAMALFVVYWLVAGPGGFAILRNFKMQRHAWLIFVATAAGFAILAWLGSRFLRQGDFMVKHVTVLTHMYDPKDANSESPQFDVASLWFSAPLPGYGMVEVGIGGEDDSSQNTLDHYSPPPNGSPDTFPDSDRYTVPFNSRAKYSVPARSTSAEFVGRFSGVPVASDGAWSGTISVHPDRPLTLEQDQDAGTIKLTGTLVNKSGVDFEKVLLIQIYPLRTPAPRAASKEKGVPLVPDELPNYGLFFELAEAWKVGEERKIGSLLYKGGALSERYRGRDSLAVSIKRSYVDQYALGRGWGSVNTVGSLNIDDQLRYMAMLGIYESLPPPTWLVQAQGQQPDTVRFHRMLGRAIDRSRQFSESCLLIVAFAEDVPCPVAISVDGELPQTKGRVMLQWIHPLRSANIRTEIEGLAAGAFWQNIPTNSASAQDN